MIHKVAELPSEAQLNEREGRREFDWTTEGLCKGDMGETMWKLLYWVIEAVRELRLGGRLSTSWLKAEVCDGMRERRTRVIEFCLQTKSVDLRRQEVVV